jgi:hypothetical protein
MMKKLVALAFCAAFGLTSFSALAEEDYYHHTTIMTTTTTITTTIITCEEGCRGEPQRCSPTKTR